MKNFAKKLSLVLAIAMVLTSIAPATASAASKDYIYKKGSAKKSTVAVYIGGSTCNLDYTIGGKTSGVKGTWKSADKTIATVDKYGVVTPVKNGTVTISFTTEDKKTTLKQTVSVRTRAAKINVYDGEEKNPAEVKVVVGEEKTLKVTLPMSSKVVAAGGKKSTYTIFAEAADGLTAVAGSRSLTVSADEAGEYAVTIYAAQQSTLAKAKADKYVKKATFTVNAVDKLAAKQTGVKKITVTGSDLTDAVADYVVKRGTVTLVIDKAEKQDDGSVVLTSASNNMPKGDYTLSFKGSDAVEFAVEAGRVDKITINPEAAILDPTDNKKAFTTYKILNQFGEDVTKTESANCTFTGATSDNQGKVTFNNGANAFTLNLSKVSISIVCNTNGVNYVGLLDVVSKAQLDTTEFKGVYKWDANKGVYVPSTVKEGENNGTGHFLVFSTKDQYGFPAVAAADIAALQVNLSSATGVKAGTGVAWTNNQLGDWAQYIAFPVEVAAGFAAFGSGDVTVLGVQTTNGKTVNGTFTVAQSQKIASLSVSAPNGVYGGQANTLDFVALDQDGNEIKDYTTLQRMNGKFSGGLAFAANADGSAKLVYTAASVPYTASAIAQPVVLTWLSETNVFGQANLSVQPNRVPMAIIGIDSNKAFGATTGTLTFKAKDFIYQDQYGNTIPSWEIATVFGHGVNTTISVEEVTQTAACFSGTVTTAAVAVTTDAVAVAADLTATRGSKTLKVSLDGVTGSDYSFTLYNVAVDNVTGYTIDYIARQNVSSEASATVAPSVYGYYAGKKIQLASADFNVIYGATVQKSAFATGEYGVKTATVGVAIKNQAGTTITKDYEYSNIAPEATTVEMSGKFSGNIPASVNTDVTAATFASCEANQWTGTGTTVLVAADQYGKKITATPRVTFSGLSWDAKTTDNGTTSAKIQWSTTGYKTVNVAYTYANGKTFETVIVVLVQ